MQQPQPAVLVDNFVWTHVVWMHKYVYGCLRACFLVYSTALTESCLKQKMCMAVHCYGYSYGYDNGYGYGYGSPP